MIMKPKSITAMHIIRKLLPYNYFPYTYACACMNECVHVRICMHTVHTYVHINVLACVHAYKYPYMQ